MPRERPAPLVLVVDPSSGNRPEPPFGSYAAVARTGQALLAAELSRRLGSLGAAVAALSPIDPAPAARFHWGRWFAAEARRALAAAASANRPVDAIGYAGAGACALLADDALNDLLSPIPGEVVANNRYSADAFVVAGDVGRLEDALVALEGSATDNAAVRQLEDAGFGSRDLAARPWSRFDVDTPLDLALLRLASRLPAARPRDGVVAGFLEMATVPGGGRLEVPNAERLGEVVRDRSAQLLVAGRIPSATWAYLETETACRVRAVVEERGMRSAPDGIPRSLLADWASGMGAAHLVDELASLADAVVLDTRVLLAAWAGSPEAAAWPAEEERFASDFLDPARAGRGPLAELTAAAAAASVPFILGGHALVSDGLRILVEAAWVGR